MSEAMLKRYYWPRWNAAFRACWEMDRGTVISKRLREEPVDATLPSPVEIEIIANRIRGNQKLTKDHLRHACHVRALGRDRSSDQLTAQEMDRVGVLMELLAEPMSISAVQRWCNPDLDARKRLLWSAERTRLPDAYLARLSEDRFGASNWRSLPTPQLRQFVMTIRAREKRRSVSPKSNSHAHAYA